MFDSQAFSKFQASFTPTSYIQTLLSRKLSLRNMIEASMMLDPSSVFQTFREGNVLFMTSEFTVFKKSMEELTTEIANDGNGAGEYLSLNYPNIVLDIQNMLEMHEYIMKFKDNTTPDYTDYARSLHLMFYMISPKLYEKNIMSLKYYTHQVENDPYSLKIALDTIDDLAKETPVQFELMNKDPVDFGDTLIVSRKESVLNWRIQLTDYLPIDYMTVLKNFCQCVRWNKEYFFVTDDYSSNDVMDSIIGNDDKSILVGIYQTENEVIKFTLVDNDYMVFNDPQDPFILDIIRKNFSIADTESDSMRHNESTCVLYLSTKADFHYQNIYLNTYRKNYLSKKCYFYFNENDHSSLDASSSIISFVYTPLAYTSKIDIHLDRNKDDEENSIDHTFSNYRIRNADGTIIYLRKIYHIEFTYVSAVMRDSVEMLVRESASQIWTNRLPLFSIIHTIGWKHKPKTRETLRQSTTNFISRKFSVLSERVSLTMANNKFATTKDNRPVYVEDLDAAVALSTACIKNRQRYLKISRKFEIPPDVYLENVIPSKIYWEMDIYRDNPSIFEHDVETMNKSIYVPYFTEAEQGVRNYNVCTLDDFIGCVNLMNTQAIATGKKESTPEELDAAKRTMDSVSPDTIAEFMSRSYLGNFYAISFSGNPPKTNVINNNIIVNRLTGGIILQTRSSNVGMSNININDFDMSTDVFSQFNERILCLDHSPEFYVIYNFDMRYDTRITFRKYLENYEPPAKVIDRYMVCKEELFGFSNDEIKKTFEWPDYDTKIHIKYLEHLTQSTIIVFEYNAATDTLDFEFPRHSLYHNKKIMYNQYLYVIKVSYIDGTFNYAFPCPKSETTFPVPIFTDHIMNIYDRRCIRVPIPTNMPSRIDVTVNSSTDICMALLKEGLRPVGQILDEHGKVHALDVKVDGFELDPATFIQDAAGSTFGLQLTSKAYFTVTLNNPIDFDIYLPVHEKYKYFPKDFVDYLPAGDIVKQPRMPTKHLIGDIGFVLYNDFNTISTINIDLPKVQFVVMTMASLVLWVSFKNNTDYKKIIADFVDVVPDDPDRYIDYLKHLESVEIIPGIKKSVFAANVDHRAFFDRRIVLTRPEYDKFVSYIEKELPYGSKHLRNQGFAFYMENTSIRAADVMYMISLRNSKKNMSSWYPIISVDDPKITMTSLENKSARLLRNNSDECIMVKLCDNKVRADALYGTVKHFVDDYVNMRGEQIYQTLYVGVSNKASGTGNPGELARTNLQDTSIKFAVIPVPKLKNARVTENVQASFRSILESSPTFSFDV